MILFMDRVSMLRSKIPFLLFADDVVPFGRTMTFSISESEASVLSRNWVVWSGEYSLPQVEDFKDLRV